MDANKDGTIDMEEWEKFMTPELKAAIQAKLSDSGLVAGFKPLVDIARVFDQSTLTSLATCRGTRSSTPLRCWDCRPSSTSTPSSTPWTRTPTAPSPSRSSRMVCPRRSFRPCRPNSTRRD